LIFGAQKFHPVQAEESNKTQQFTAASTNGHRRTSPRQSFGKQYRQNTHSDRDAQKLFCHLRAGEAADLAHGGEVAAQRGRHSQKRQTARQNAQGKQSACITKPVFTDEFRAAEQSCSGQQAKTAGIAQTSFHHSFGGLRRMLGVGFHNQACGGKFDAGGGQRDGKRIYRQNELIQSHTGGADFTREVGVKKHGNQLQQQGTAGQNTCVEQKSFGFSHSVPHFHVFTQCTLKMYMRKNGKKVLKVASCKLQIVNCKLQMVCKKRRWTNRRDL